MTTAGNQKYSLRLSLKNGDQNRTHLPLPAAPVLEAPAGPDRGFALRGSHVSASSSSEAGFVRNAGSSRSASSETGASALEEFLSHRLQSLFHTNFCQVTSGRRKLEATMEPT